MDTSHLLYASDLTDREWALLEPLLPPESPVGRPRLYSLRIILNAIFYELRTGGAWRFLPQEWPPWKTVYHYWRKWRLDGTWERLHTALRERWRVRLGRNPQPSAGSIDSQSVKTTSVGDCGATMAASKSRDASATCSWTRKDWSCAPSCIPPASWIATA